MQGIERDEAETYLSNVCRLSEKWRVSERVRVVSCAVPGLVN